MSLFAVVDAALHRAVGTVRSADKAARRQRQVASFNDPNSAMQVFVANINTLATGVNLHTCCHVGVVCCHHHNAKAVRQAHSRLYRLGQRFQVVWHGLRVSNSFHDHQERICLVKYARQLSAEMVLPDWIPADLREPVIFEFQRAYFVSRPPGAALPPVSNVFGHRGKSCGIRSTRLDQISQVRPRRHHHDRNLGL